MDKLIAYLDGLLDSGAETFPRQVLERIKALMDAPQPPQKEFIYIPYWPPQKYEDWWRGPVTYDKFVVTTGATTNGPINSSGMIWIDGTVQPHK